VTKRELVAVHVEHLFEEVTVQVEAFKVPVICKALQNQHVEEAKRVNPYLNKLWLSDICSRQENLEVDMLIGADYLWKFMRGEVVRGEKDEPVAISTSLGWMVSGPLKILNRSLQLERIWSHTFWKFRNNKCRGQCMKLCQWNSKGCGTLTR